MLDERALDSIQSFPGGPHVLENAVYAYLRDAADGLRGLRSACHGGDRDTIRRVAHTLKSSSAMLGATQLSGLFRELEEDSTAAAPGDLISRLDRIEVEYAAVKRDLGDLVSRGAATPPPLAPERRPVILVVDDDAAIRVTLAGVLRADGFTVEEVPDGPTALDRVASLRPDLVILDVMMQGMDGFEVCARLRAIPAGARMPVLMLTGHEDPAALQRAFEVGATDFMSKRLAPALLSHRVRFILRLTTALEDAHRSEARLAEAQRIARVGNWEWWVATGVVRGSVEAFRLLGLGTGTQKCHVHQLYARVHPDERAHLTQAFQAVAAGSGSLDGEYRVLVEDGQERHVQIIGEAVRGENGVVRVAGTVQDVTERVQSQRRIQTLAYHDALTGLPNRRLFGDQLHKVFSAARRKQRRAAVMLVDLDNFKQINDTLGHSAGDQVLVDVAARLRDVVRAYDTVSREVGPEELHTVARLGGDEFLLAIADLGSGEDAAVVAGRVLKAFTAPFQLGGGEMYLSASIGISVFPDDGDELETLLKHADVALYQAKDAGRNTGEFFNESMNAAAFQRLLLETNLRRALERDELTVHFQPQVDARDGRLVGAEALLRWSHPELGAVPPVQFVPAAERIGLIGALTELALSRTCAQFVAWRQAGLQPLRLSVNLSPQLLRRPEVVAALVEIPRAAGVEASWIEFEITESALMEKPQEAERILADLKRRGFRLAMDDFGTGYSSLSYLRRFPLDTLKIDRAFVHDVAANTDNAAIVSAVVGLARGLGLEPVAEGVEDEAQRDVLRQCGCVLMQGYLFGKPVPAEEFTKLLAPVGQSTGARGGAKGT